ncbi:MAG TPA: DUF6790 family protein [Thermomicrobiales bacterium]|nr:DUF6790 family protein [Thermomicrobiales bacterium]
MVFFGFYVLGLLTAVVRLLRRPGPPTPRQIVDTTLQSQLVVGFGLAGLFSFSGHRFRSSEAARSIGWEPGSPFQQEVAFANLGVGLAGVLCAWKRGGFWLATAIAGSAFSLGAALVHIDELRRTGNTAINNTGAIAPDILIPGTILGLLAARRLTPDDTATEAEA